MYSFRKLIIFVSAQDKMHRLFKISMLMLVLSGIVFASYADRGITRRAKKKVVVNIPASFKKGSSASVSSGASFKGSFTDNCNDECSTQPSNHVLMTYQKGNSVYIVPVRQKVFHPESDNTLIIPKLVVRPS